MYDKWETIELLLPCYGLNCALFQVDQNKLAIMSGRFTKAVYIFEVDSNPHNLNKPGYKSDEVFKLYEIEGFDHNVETLYPVLYVSERNIVYIVQGRSGQDEPSVATYSFREFLKPPKQEP
jgi:hypothetical protein